jgi:prepilin-type N-terminal cleavage/methylation domain-containing protein
MLQKLRGRNKKGFTLIELMIVIAIIGILAAIAIPNFIAYRNKAFCSGMANDAKNVGDAIAEYFTNENYTNLPSMTLVEVGFKSENTFTYGGNPLSSIYITVTDASQRCPRGSHYVKTMPADTTDGYSN